jgi:4-hydroxybenzoate polyprenyltransferase
MLKKSTIQLLRFPFSFFLMPVFWFALSMLREIDWYKAAILFFILHVLVYPSSNGYNSLQDQDKGSIGGLERPPQPDLELNGLTRTMDTLAIVYSMIFLGVKYAIILVYQHEQDKADGVTTISMLLGKRGTFVFCGLLYAISFSLLALYFNTIQSLYSFFILQLFFIPVIVFFLFWAFQVWKDARNADYKRTMRMNWIASIASNGGFITLLILKHFG